MEAEEMDPEAIEQRQEIRRDKDKQWRTFGYVLTAISCLGLVVLAITLGVTLGRSSNKTAISRTATPTMAPTASFISIPPDSPFDVFMQDLPNHTLLSLGNISTPQFKAMQWMMEHPDLPNMTQWRKKQLFALSTFFFAMEGPHWPEHVQQDWRSHTDECFWFSSEFGAFMEDGRYEQQENNYNVTPCNDAGEFQSLALANLSLAGYKTFIPPASRVSESSAEATSPDAIAFDKAEKAESVEKLREALNETRTRIQSCEDIIAKPPSDKALEAAEKEREQLLMRAEKQTALIERKEQKISET